MADQLTQDINQAIDDWAARERRPGGFLWPKRRDWPAAQRLRMKRQSVSRKRIVKNRLREAVYHARTFELMLKHRDQSRADPSVPSSELRALIKRYRGQAELDQSASSEDPDVMQAIGLDHHRLFAAQADQNGCSLPSDQSGEGQ
jgi:hypothetical protein